MDLDGDPRRLRRCLIVSFGSDFIGAFLFVGVSAAMMLPERYGPAAVGIVSAATLAACLADGVDGSKTAAAAIERVIAHPS